MSRLFVFKNLLVFFCHDSKLILCSQLFLPDNFPVCWPPFWKFMRANPGISFRPTPQLENAFQIRCEAEFPSRLNKFSNCRFMHRPFDPCSSLYESSHRCFALRNSSGMPQQTPMICGTRHATQPGAALRAFHERKVKVQDNPTPSPIFPARGAGNRIWLPDPSQIPAKRGAIILPSRQCIPPWS